LFIVHSINSIEEESQAMGWNKNFVFFRICAQRFFSTLSFKLMKGSLEDLRKSLDREKQLFAKSDMCLYEGANNWQAW